MSETSTFHPSADDLARLLDQDTDAATRSTLLAHVADCPDCAEAMRVTLALAADTQTLADNLAASASESKAESTVAPGWMRPFAIAATLAMALGLGVWLMPASQPDELVMRGGSTVQVTPAPGTRLESIPNAFKWSNPNPGQFILSDAHAQTLFEALAEEGEIGVAGELEHILSKGGRFLWRIEVDGRTLGPYPFVVSPTNQ